MASKQKRLQKGRAVRAHITSDLRNVRDGTLSWEDMLRKPTPALGRVRTFTFMCAIPGIGEKKIKKILTKAKVWPEDRLGNVEEPKREYIIELVKGFLDA